MGQIVAGEVFTGSVPGKSVTPTRLNAHVNNAVLDDGAVTEQGAATPALTDSIMFYDLSGTALAKATLTALFGIQVVDAIAATGSLRTIGIGAQAAAPGNFRALENVFTGTTQQFKHIKGTTGIGIAANANLGASGTATLGANSSDISGGINIHAQGAGLSAGILATVTFGVPYAATPQIILVGYDLATLGVQAASRAMYVTTPTENGFNISNGTVLIAGDYVLAYIVIGI